jgi:hypothetical protein
VLSVKYKYLWELVNHAIFWIYYLPDIIYEYYLNTWTIIIFNLPNKLESEESTPGHIASSQIKLEP